mmetsp:Transcript_30525/g.76787  ORF Transcript_30525/g.76787 Transcript_30525/m.76787 type:complete len:222 (-) Transcript_30525:365-1030(-)
MRGRVGAAGGGARSPRLACPHPNVDHDNRRIVPRPLIQSQVRQRLGGPLHALALVDGLLGCPESLALIHDIPQPIASQNHHLVHLGQGLRRHFWFRSHAVLHRLVAKRTRHGQPPIHPPQHNTAPRPLDACHFVRARRLVVLGQHPRCPRLPDDGPRVPRMGHDDAAVLHEHHHRGRSRVFSKEPHLLDEPAVCVYKGGAECMGEVLGCCCLGNGAREVLS